MARGGSRAGGQRQAIWAAFGSLGAYHPATMAYVGIQNARRVHKEISDLWMAAAAQGWTLRAQAPADYTLAAEERRAVHSLVRGGTPPSGLVSVGKETPGTQGTGGAAPTAERWTKCPSLEPMLSVLRMVPLGRLRFVISIVWQSYALCLQPRGVQLGFPVVSDKSQCGRPKASPDTW